ncbi:MAG TPA: ATP-binding protein [Bacillota bacterium]|nr:ATP-binding protein [Bacillota bacterium]
MFTRTRWRLTIIFSSLLMGFLLSFTAITYFMVASTIFDQQKQQVLKVVEQQWHDHSKDLERHDYDRKDYERKDLGRKERKEAFYYVISKDGEVIHGDESFPELRDKILAKIKEWKPTPNEVAFEEFGLSDGNEVLLAFAGRTVQDMNHNVLGTVYSGIDVTPQHEVLHQLSYILLILSVVFIILSAVIGYYMAGRAMVPIANSFTRQRQFVADASHELRTPLSVMQSTVEVMEADRENQFSEFSKQILFDMKDEILRMNRLVGDLLTLARVDSGTIQLNIESFDLRDVLNHLLRTIQSILEQRKLMVDVISEEQILVYADRERITQLLFILIDNAIKYTGDEGRITIHLNMLGEGTNSGKKLCFSIQDTGIGIPEEEKSRIFERFHRVDKARSRDHGGTGLGLSIANWIVKEHGGSILVESTMGKGSTFTITLPQ